MKPAPVSRSARLQVAATLLIIALFIVFVNWLHRVAPTAPLSGQEVVLDEVLSGQTVSCERTLPAAEVENVKDLVVRGPIGLVRSTQVNQCPRRFDGRFVTYVGEAVGDVLRRTGGAWVQLNDDDFALIDGPLPSHRSFTGTNTGLAVWLPDELVDLVQHPGRRGLRGDVLVVQGILHRADPRDGGGLTLRALDAQLLRASVPIDRPIHGSQAWAALVLGLAATALIVYERASRDSN